MTLFVAVIAALAVVLLVPPVRRVLITNHVLAVYRRILPDMSQPPRRKRSTPAPCGGTRICSRASPTGTSCSRCHAPKLSAEEQAFLDGPVEKLCAMVQRLGDHARATRTCRRTSGSSSRTRASSA